MAFERVFDRMQTQLLLNVRETPMYSRLLRSKFYSYALLYSMQRVMQWQKALGIVIGY